MEAEHKPIRMRIQMRTMNEFNKSGFDDVGQGWTNKLKQSRRRLWSLRRTRGSRHTRNTAEVWHGIQFLAPSALAKFQTVHALHRSPV